ncbi:sensor histidine kinase [Paenibacillus sp. Marseille-Q4541]|uniref:sensor histidine kinase n=1 Tax=Paenibacillus sp. Marseille-Q4541 TaxID=2831522 RepID=UPI001BA79144|nr:sensor histidine kinase [Paenibacillus sp. Marseille-Q4541]
MKIVPRVSAVFILSLLGILLFGPSPVSHAAEEDHLRKLTSWDMIWLTDTTEISIDKLIWGKYKWKTIHSDAPLVQQLRAAANTAWIRVTLPEELDGSTGIFFEHIYGQQIKVYKEGQILFEQDLDDQFDKNPVLLPISVEDAGTNIYIWTHSEKEKVGMDQSIWIGPIANLNKKFVVDGLADLMIGGLLLLSSFVIATYSLFMFRLRYKLWVGISALVGCLGITISMYSSTIYTFYPDLSQVCYYLFLISFAVELPLIAYCFEQIFTSDSNRIIRKMRNFLIVYVVICILCKAVSLLYPDEVYSFSQFVTGPVFGVIFIVELLILLYVTVREAIKGERGAALLSIGFGLFVLTASTEWILYYIVPWYNFTMTKWAVLVFVGAIITVKGHRLLGKHEQVVLYTKELEVFSNELQRSEKIKIISELAASVAHEVRNPLQVTRGFLQLMSKQEDVKNRKYVGIALEELDRASDIINDFLTFAKPEFDHITLVNLAEEFNHIEGVLIPMANLEGGVISIDVPSNLWIRGNSSKFKQAFINIMKNSIEALQGNGEVKVKAYTRGTEIVIHVQDNGIGMSGEELARLGEPYFSNKTKGTGLGMMVTFRIIEAMEGSIEYSSEKGAGTEAVIRFPSGT